MNNEFCKYCHKQITEDDRAWFRPRTGTRVEVCQLCAYKQFKRSMADDQLGLNDKSVCWKCLGSGVLGARGQYACQTCDGTGKTAVPPGEEEDTRQPDAGYERLHGKLPEGSFTKINIGQLRRLIRESISTSASQFKKGDVVQITTGVKRGLATKQGLVAFVHPNRPELVFVLVASPSSPWKKPRISDRPWIEAYDNVYLQSAPDQPADWMNDTNLKRAIDQWASIENGPKEVKSWYWTNYDDYADEDPEAEGSEMPDELYEKLLAFRDEIFKTGVVPV